MRIAAPYYAYRFESDNNKPMVADVRLPGSLRGRQETDLR
jgi:hypothetical protein